MTLMTMTSIDGDLEHTAYGAQCHIATTYKMTPQAMA